DDAASVFRGDEFGVLRIVGADDGISDEAAVGVEDPIYLHGWLDWTSRSASWSGLPPIEIPTGGPRFRAVFSHGENRTHWVWFLSPIGDVLVDGRVEKCRFLRDFVKGSK